MENQTQPPPGFPWLLSGPWLKKKPAEFAFGVYIILEEPTKPMIEEATTAGFYKPEYFPGTYYPRVQILTVQ